MDMRNFLESLNEGAITKLTEASGAMVGKKAEDLAAMSQWKYWPEKAYADNSVRIVVMEEGPDAWKIFSLSQKLAKKSSAADKLAAMAGGKKTAAPAPKETEVQEMRRLMGLSVLTEAASGENDGKPEAAAGWTIEGESKTFKFAELLEECVNIVQDDGAGSSVVNLAK